MVDDDDEEEEEEEEGAEQAEPIVLFQLPIKNDMNIIERSLSLDKIYVALSVVLQ